MRQYFILLSVFIVSVLAGCERARPYPPRIFAEAPSTKDVVETEPAKPQSYLTWREPKKASVLSPDLPIVFVPSTSPEWNKLKEFWNVLPPRSVFLPTAGVAMSPLVSPFLRSAAAMELAGKMQIKIKVPLGLPDPTPLIPAANSPTYAKWKLGKELFFEKMLHVKPSLTAYSCASCHQPGKRFMDDRSVSLEMKYRTPTLINVVYNRHQFWDGRVKNLEEVVTRDLSDEAPPVTPERFGQHVFGGLVKKLDDDPYFKNRFLEVFGNLPTQDLIGKALATYMRTILSGNSQVDQTILSGQIEKGQKLFTGKANCAACHLIKDGLYTDHDFHNIGLYDFIPALGVSPEGRLARVPAGLKETRLFGAYRTPSLRNVVNAADGSKEKRSHYMHNGQSALQNKGIDPKGPLFNVLEHFNNGINPNPDNMPNPYLSSALLDSKGIVRKLELTADEMQALADFLAALEGEPVDRIVTTPPKK